MKHLDDQSPMPFGKHKNKPMEDVPASYLLWLYEEMRGKTMYPGSGYQLVGIYIQENMDVLIHQMKSEA